MDIIMDIIIDKAKIIEIINSKMSFPLFKKERISLNLKTLPFFDNYDLLTAKTFSTIPFVKFYFLWNNKTMDAIKMDGSSELIFENLPKMGLQLTEGNVVKYVQFVLASVWDSNGTIRLVERFENVELSDSLSSEEMDFLKSNIHKASVICDDKNGYTIRCNIIYGESLYSAVVEVKDNGEFDIANECQVGGIINALRTIFLE